MKTSDVGINLIKRFEGFESEPYLCPAGKWTIGYGWTHGVTKDSKPITEAEATKLLADGLGSYEIGVLDCVDVDLQQCEFDALVSFAYNLGVHALRGSTLLKKLNEADYEGAADQFLRWDKANGKVLAGLTKRREAERELFLNG
jgi:GH24 family phage-related lysozyme (muramidase)